MQLPEATKSENKKPDYAVRRANLENQFKVYNKERGQAIQKALNNFVRRHEEANSGHHTGESVTPSAVAAALDKWFKLKTVSTRPARYRYLIGGPMTEFSSQYVHFS